jgi:hypothetical protein
MSTKTTLAGYTGELTDNHDGTVTFAYSDEADRGSRVTGPREHLEKMLAQIRDQRARRARWPKDTSQALIKLAKMFPSLEDAPGIDPWDVDTFIKWLNGPAPGAGASAAGRFILGVWNNHTDWTELGLAPPGRFSVFEGLAVWDHAHVAAFQAWVDAPFWP